MKYFLIETMRNFTDMPYVQGWYKKIDVRNITPQKIESIVHRTLFKVDPNPNLVFVDVLSSPFFMVTKKIRKAIELHL